MTFHPNSVDRLAENDEERCAVADCLNRGRPQVCPYDGKYHHHGRIHYDTPINAEVTFRQDAWRLVCDRHFEDLKARLIAWRQARRRDR